MLLLALLGAARAQGPGGMGFPGGVSFPGGGGNNGSNRHAIGDLLSLADAETVNSPTPRKDLPSHAADLSTPPQVTDDRCPMVPRPTPS